MCSSDLPLGSDTGAYAAMAALQARILGAPDDERDAAAAAAVRVASHELLVKAAQADERGAARRECPVTLSAPDGSLLEGVVDLAFHDGNAWVVVDFKTDREISAEHLDRYRRQVAVYAAAIAKATGEAASATLVRV